MRASKVIIARHRQRNNHNQPPLPIEAILRWRCKRLCIYFGAYVRCPSLAPISAGFKNRLGAPDQAFWLQQKQVDGASTFSASGARHRSKVLRHVATSRRIRSFHAPGLCAVYKTARDKETPLIGLRGLTNPLPRPPPTPDAPVRAAPLLPHPFAAARSDASGPGNPYAPRRPPIRHESARPGRKECGY